MSKSWDELKRDFCHMTAVRGVSSVAEAIPASRATVYRLIKGEVQNPSLSIKARVERMVDESENQPEGDQ